MSVSKWWHSPSAGTLSSPRWLRLIPLVIILLSNSPGRASAERLPIKAYGPAEGLPSTLVEHVMRDGRGFLWFSTRDGLSRFDGTRFVNYSVEHGLPNPTINYALQAGDGSYWIATNGGGVCRLDATAALPTTRRDQRALFQVYRVGPDTESEQVNTLHEDSQGRIWAGTDAGLFRFDRAGGRFVQIPLGLRLNVPVKDAVHTLTEDRDGTLWIGLGWGLMRYTRDGQRTHIRLRPTVRDDSVFAVRVDDSGRLWIGHQSGLVIWRPDVLAGTREGDAEVMWLLRGQRPAPLPLSLASPVALPAHAGERLWLALNPGGFEVAVTSFQPFGDRQLWIGTHAGLVELDGTRFRRYSTPEGLSDSVITALAADAAGNLWAATMAGGVMKLTRRGFRSFDEADGLGDARVHAIAEDASGAVLAVSGDWTINRLEGRRFTHARPRLETDLQHPWNSQVGFLDRDQRWWLLTHRDLRRYSPGARPDQIASMTRPTVYPGIDAFRVYENRRGDIWIALRREAIARWVRETDTLEVLDRAKGFPPLIPTALAEDAAGTLWVGTRTGDFLRYRNGRFERYAPRPAANGIGTITSMWADDTGRVWAGSNRDGLIRIDPSETGRPRLSYYSRANGLSSNNVRSVVSDREGRIYAGTAGGVDRLDPASGRIQHYTTVDGLASGFVTAAFRDSRGDLWFGTMRGLSRLTLAPGDPPPGRWREITPQVLIGGISVAGTPRDVSHVGEAQVRGVVLPPGQRSLQIDFFGLAFGMGEALRYRHRLEGIDRDWSSLSEERTVRYSALAPRDYRFVVEAVSADGTISATPAIVQVSVPAALWERRWFHALLLVLTASAGYMLYRLRLAQLLALERVRTRIASDLHDDIGATLAQIAVLSEVVQSQIDEPHASLRAPLARVAQASRETIASMSDIVWAINPQKDSLDAMVLRIREFANEVLASRGMSITLDAPESNLRLGADVRRQLYLVLKEALNNVLRHSNATHVAITIAADSGRLQLRVEDNGRGFDLAGAADEGNGLTNMRRRAERLGGSLEVTSRPGRTVVAATVPIGWRASARSNASM
jgi:ligand-binding sensor domain-containing protein/signal transduction histidine kinase